MKLSRFVANVVLSLLLVAGLAGMASAQVPTRIDDVEIYCEKAEDWAAPVGDGVVQIGHGVIIEITGENNAEPHAIYNGKQIGPGDFSEIWIGKPDTVIYRYTYILEEGDKCSGTTVNAEQVFLDKPGRLRSNVLHTTEPGGFHMDAHRPCLTEKDWGFIQFDQTADTLAAWDFMYGLDPPLPGEPVRHEVNIYGIVDSTDAWIGEVRQPCNQAPGATLFRGVIKSNVGDTPSATYFVPGGADAVVTLEVTTPGPPGTAWFRVTGPFPVTMVKTSADPTEFVDIGATGLKIRVDDTGSYPYDELLLGQTYTMVVSPRRREAVDLPKVKGKFAGAVVGNWQYIGDELMGWQSTGGYTGTVLGAEVSDGLIVDFGKNECTFASSGNNITLDADRPSPVSNFDLWTVDCEHSFLEWTPSDEPAKYWVFRDTYDPTMIVIHWTWLPGPASVPPNPYPMPWAWSATCKMLADSLDVPSFDYPVPDTDLANLYEYAVLARDRAGNWDESYVHLSLVHNKTLEDNKAPAQRQWTKHEYLAGPFSPEETKKDTLVLAWAKKDTTDAAGIKALDSVVGDASVSYCLYYTTDLAVKNSIEAAKAKHQTIGADKTAEDIAQEYIAAGKLKPVPTSTTEITNYDISDTLFTYIVTKDTPDMEKWWYIYVVAADSATCAGACTGACAGVCPDRNLSFSVPWEVFIDVVPPMEPTYLKVAYTDTFNAAVCNQPPCCPDGAVSWEPYTEAVFAFDLCDVWVPGDSVAVLRRLGNAPDDSWVDSMMPLGQDSLKTLGVAAWARKDLPDTCALGICVWDECDAAPGKTYNYHWTNYFEPAAPVTPVQEWYYAAVTWDSRHNRSWQRAEEPEFEQLVETGAVAGVAAVHDAATDTTTVSWTSDATAVIPSSELVYWVYRGEKPIESLDACVLNPTAVAGGVTIPNPCYRGDIDLLNRDAPVPAGVKEFEYAVPTVSDTFYYAVVPVVGFNLAVPCIGTHGNIGDDVAGTGGVIEDTAPPFFLRIVASKALSEGEINEVNYRSIDLCGQTELGAKVRIKAIHKETEKDTLSAWFASNDSTGYWKGTIDVSSLPDGWVRFEAQAEDAYFNKTAWQRAETLQPVSGTSWDYAVFWKATAPIDPVDDLVVDDYKGVSGVGDHGGFVLLSFEPSADNDRLSRYRVWREVSVYGGGVECTPATWDTTWVTYDFYPGDPIPPELGLPWAICPPDTSVTIRVPEYTETPATCDTLDSEKCFVDWAVADPVYDPDCFDQKIYVVVPTIDNEATRYKVTAEIGGIKSEAATGSGPVLATLVDSGPSAMVLGGNIISSQFSNVALGQATDDIAPAAATEMRAVDTPGDAGGSVTLTWTKSVDEGVVHGFFFKGKLAYIYGVTGYEIYRNGKLIATVDRGVAAYVDGTAENNVPYTYTVKATDGTFAIPSENNVAIAVNNTLPGDFDSSLKVWTGDFAMFVSNFGLGEADAEFDPVYDLDGDGKVWTGDFTAFVGLFGSTTGAAKPIIASADGVNTGASAALAISREGAAITVDVCVEGLTELASYGLMVSFDSEALQFLGASEGNLLQSNALFAAIPTKAGEVWVLSGQPEAVSTTNGLLSQLHFRALNDQAVGSAIRVDALDLFDRDASLNSVAQGLEATVAPEKFALLQNYPNPGNPSTVISYTLAKDSKVNLTVYNTLGQEVRTLVDGHQTANIYKVVWDARDDNGREVASGIYFYRLVTGKFNATKRLIVLK